MASWLSLPEVKRSFPVLHLITSLTVIAPCNHKRVDTRILLHVRDAPTPSEFTKVGLRTVGKDVIAISIGVFEGIEGLDKFGSSWGTGVNRRVFAIHDIFLGSNRARALPVFHAFTGCDTVSSKGEKSAWQTWIRYDDVTAAFLACSSMSEDSQERIERFVVLFYDRTSRNSLVNEERKQLFAEKGRPMGAIPPTKGANKVSAIDTQL